MLVASGLITLDNNVLDGSAAGVTTTDISKPPDAMTGAMSEEKCRLCDEGRGVYGGHIATERTSCACIRREDVCIQRIFDLTSEELSDPWLVLTREY